MVRVLFVHPDLGIGGAERLVVDAAVALQNKGHSVSFLTNHFNPNHCFEELRNRTVSVTTVGDWLPRNIFGKLYALCAYIRMLYAALYTVLVLSRSEKIDLIFCDLISIGIPIFQLANHKPKVLYYCHHPDQLLSLSGSSLKQFYRMPLNYLEELTTGKADRILVNSKYTGSVYEKTFTTLKSKPDVLYPSLNTKYFDEMPTSSADEISHDIPSDAIVFLSINRYERKKNLSLLLRALDELKHRLTDTQWNDIIVVIAGGYDERVDENVSHFAELVQLANAELNLSDKVRFIKSPSDKSKVWLLNRCEALVYTPQNEHFGIVPIEGMYCRKPIIAVNSGGPTETVLANSTGYLCDSDPTAFALAMEKFVVDRTLSETMGASGRRHVEENFSFHSFSNKLDQIVDELVNKKEQ